MVVKLKSEQIKGQFISKAIYGLLTSPKKWTDEFVLFAFLLFKANKSNSSVCFLGESTARQSAFWFYLTFRSSSRLSNYMYSMDFLSSHFITNVSWPFPVIKIKTGDTQCIKACYFTTCTLLLLYVCSPILILMTGNGQLTRDAFEMK